VKKNVQMYLLAGTIVLSNLVGSIILKFISNCNNEIGLLIVGFGIVAFLNIVRMLVWYFANRNFPLNKFYPMTSLIFPGILFVALLFGEKIGVYQIAGALLIAFGVAHLGSEREIKTNSLVNQENQ